MDYESKFLDKNYLATRLRDFKDIKNGNVTFDIYESDRAESASLYVRFFVNGFNRHTLRVSDHTCTTPHTQFIVCQTDILSKKKKEQFVKLVESSIRKAKSKGIEKALQHIN